MEKVISQQLAGIATKIQLEQAAPKEKAVYKVDVHQNALDTVTTNTGPARYIVSSERFSGKAELIYLDGILQDVKLMETNMKPPQRQSFKSLVPVLERQLPEFWKHTGVGVIREEYEVSFEQFWNDYHKTLNTVKDHRERALKEWNVVSATDRLKAWLYIKEYKAFLEQPRNKGRGIKNADTYLKAKPWRNE